MEDYIHPDAEFKWRKGDQMIERNATHTISYVTGLRGQAQNGGTTNSRFSALTISNLRVADEGVYTCFVMGTQESADVQLYVAPLGT